MLDRDQILKDLRDFVLEIQFTKVDGSNRVLRCTLRPDLLPPNYINEQHEEKKFHKENENIIAAWDVVNAGWRSFRIDSVQYVQNVNDAY